MKGHVRHANPSRGMYSIVDGDGEFTVIETSEHLFPGEQIKLSISSETIVTKNGKFDCIVQLEGCTS